MPALIRLTVPRHEADNLSALFQCALNGKGNLTQIDDVLDGRAAAACSDDSCVVELHAILALRDWLRIKIVRTDYQVWILSCEDGKRLFRSRSAVVPSVVKICHHHVAAKTARDRFQLRWRGEAL